MRCRRLAITSVVAPLLVVGCGRESGQEDVGTESDVAVDGTSGEDADPPTVSFRAPSDGSEVKRETTVEIDAGDDTGLRKVELRLNGDLEKTFQSKPYRWDWNVSEFPPGDYQVTAKAEDVAGKTASASIDVAVRRPCGADDDCGPEDVEFVYPRGGSEVCGNVLVKASATDDNGISRVEFGVGGESIGRANDRPFSVRWDTTTHSDGQYRLRATAFDPADQSFFSEISVQVSNEESECVNRPVVRITEPEDGAYVSGPVRIQAEASDDVGVTNIRFFVDNNQIKEDTSAPYGAQWNVSDFEEGAHNIKARATDVDEESSSDSIDVTIDTSAPTISFREPKDGEVYHDQLPVKLDVEETGRVEDVAVEVPSADVSATINDSPWETTLDVGDLSAGGHRVVARATDAAGHQSSADQAFQIDRPPEVSFEHPAPDTRSPRPST